MKPEQKDLFGSGARTYPSVTLSLKGLGPVPSFKNCKIIRTWLEKVGKVVEFISGHWWVRKDTLKIRSMLYLEPKHQQWMSLATQRFESQLRSALATIEGETQTGASLPLQIATLLPCDDCWTAFRELEIKSELCEPGQEGATITIQRLR